MKQTMKKIVQTGYGLGFLSFAEAKKVVRRVQKDLNLDDDESIKLAQELVKNSEKASKRVLGTATEFFESALVKSGIASKGEVKTAKKVFTKRADKVKTAVRERVKKGLH